MESTPKFLSGIFAFSGTGLDHPMTLDASLSYTVSASRRAQLVYLRAGNSSSELVCLTLLRDGKPMRLFPIGAKSSQHVPLTVTEDLQPDTKIEVFASAPAGTSGHIVIDLGLIEV